VTKVTHTPGAGRARLMAALAKLDGVSGQVGWFASAKYKTGVPVAYVATIHEYGYPPKNIPPRMGLRPMIQDKQASWAQFAEHGAKAVLAGTMTVVDAMTLIGARAEGDIRKQIASVQQPILAVQTLEARARFYGVDGIGNLSATGRKPLNFTGLMIATVSHVVFEKGAQVAGVMKSGDAQ